MAENTPSTDLAVLIMAGGMGTRFWPASRVDLPKQFLPICGPRSMLEESVRRIEPLVNLDRVFVIINGRHRTLTQRILDNLGGRMIEEPCGRNTAPCIGLGCLHVMKNLGNVPTVALPADHFITSDDGFRQCLVRGGSLLTEGGIGTVGVTPTHPETGYGYIERGKALGRTGVFRVNRFVEKPDPERARNFLKSRKYLWNAGIFFFRPATMLGEIGKFLPHLGRGLDRISEAMDTVDYLPTLERVYREIESVSIDYGVMEKTEEPIWVIQGDFGWSDVGSWAAVRKLREAEADQDGNLAPDKTVLLDTSKAFIHSQSGRLIAILGLDNLLVVDTDDVLLIADVNRSQGVRRFPEILRQKGWDEYV